MAGSKSARGGLGWGKGLWGGWGGGGGGGGGEGVGGVVTTYQATVRPFAVVRTGATKCPPIHQSREQPGIRLDYLGRSWKNVGKRRVALDGLYSTFGRGKALRNFLFLKTSKKLSRMEGGHVVE